MTTAALPQHRRRRHGKKKARINPFVIAYMVALIGLASIGYYVANYQIKNKLQMIEDKYFVTDLAFYDLPRINLTLTNIGGGTNGRVRMDISLEVAAKDIDKLQDFQPRIMDTVIHFMHQYDVDDIKPTGSMSQLHQNLLNEVNQVSKPIPIHNIVFRQFVVQ